MSDAAIQTGQTATAGAGQAQAPGAGVGQTAATGAPGSSTPAGATGQQAANGAHDTPWHHAVFTDPAVRQAVHTGGFKNADEFGKAFVETKSLVGRKGVIVPGETATPEERAAALAQFGRPEKPEGYKFAYPDGYQPNDSDKAYETRMRAAAHKAGLPAWAFETFAAAHMEHFGEAIGKAKQAETAAFAAGAEEIKALEAKWGTNAERNKALAQTAAQTLYPPDSPEYAKLEKLLGAGAMVDHFYRVGTMMSENGGVLRAGAGQKSFGPLTKESAAQKIKETRDAATADPKHPYVNALHPEHAAMQKQMMEWYAIAHPGMQEER